MFSFFNRTPKLHIDCFTSNSTAYKFAPIVNSYKARPEWFDKVTPPQPSNTNSRFFSVDDHGLIGFNRDRSLRTLKSCPGFSELYRRGFILESWCDMAFNVDQDVFSYYYSNGKQMVLHDPGQVYPGFKDYHIVKLCSPWHLNIKESVPFIALAAEWSLEDYNFKVLPGVVDYQIQTSTNAFIAVRKNIKEQFIVNIGQPLIHFIPLIDKKLVIHNHIVTDAELEKIKYNETGTASGWRRTAYLTNRNAKREKESKCPFGFGK